MQSTDRAEFAQLVTDVHAYYRQDCTQFVLSVWWSGCEQFDLDQVRHAMTAHAKDPEAGRFCPKLADIVKVLQGTSTDRAAIAWGKVHEAMGAVGGYQDVVFDDPAIHAVIEDLGGWPKVCRTEAKEMGYLQHRFTEGHRAYVGRGTFAYPRQLMGDRSPDYDYERRGIPLPNPALIGDQERARAVYERGAQAGKTAITFGSAVNVLSKLQPPLPAA